LPDIADVENNADVRESIIVKVVAEDRDYLIEEALPTDPV